MTLAVLEFNDQSLSIQAVGGHLYSEPGFARLTTEGVETGEPARATNWREPQHSYNQYWNQLNQTPMAARQPWARHHADMAFAQLKSLWLEAGSPESLVLLVPGSFNDTQLSLLLGLVGALPASPLAVIDNALTACLDADGKTLFADLQLNQLVLTVLEPEGNTLQIADQEVFPELGMMQIHNSVARYISNMLIDSSRFDPLHDSASEQTIFDRIPTWLEHLCWEIEVSATLDTRQGELPFILRSERVQALIKERTANIQSWIARQQGVSLKLSQPSFLLQGLTELFSDAEVLARPGIEQFLDHQDALLGQLEGIYRVRSLQRDNKQLEQKSGGPIPATHILYGGNAYPLDHPVSIRVNGSGLLLSNAVDRKAALTIVMNQRKLEALHQDPGFETLLPDNPHPGASISIGEHELMLIEVKA